MLCQRHQHFVLDFSVYTDVYVHPVLTSFFHEHGSAEDQAYSKAALVQVVGSDSVRCALADRGDVHLERGCVLIVFRCLPTST